MSFFFMHFLYYLSLGKDKERNGQQTLNETICQRRENGPWQLMSAVRDGSPRSSQKQFRLSDLFKSCNIGHTLVIGCNIGLMDDECNEDSILITYSQMLRCYQYSVKVCTQAIVYHGFHEATSITTPPWMRYQSLTRLPPWISSGFPEIAGTHCTPEQKEVL